MAIRNLDIRKAIQQSELRHWQVADILGIAETTFCRMLRRELPSDKKLEIIAAISEAANACTNLGELRESHE